jgi:hypothetical protein
MLVHCFDREGEASGSSREDFFAFSRALGLPLSSVGTLSASGLFEEVELRLGWVADAPAGQDDSMGIRDVVTCWAEHLTSEGSDGALARYHTQRFEVIAKRFGVLEGIRGVGRAGVPAILRSIVSRCLPDDPWSGWLEYTFLPGEEGVHRRFGTMVRTVEARRAGIYLEYAAGLLVAWRPELAELRVPLQELEEAGFPTTKPEIDMCSF